MVRYFQYHHPVSACFIFVVHVSYLCILRSFVIISHTVKVKVKVKPSTCIAPCMVKTTLKRSGMDHTVLPATNTMPALPRKRSPDGASTD